MTQSQKENRVEEAIKTLEEAMHNRYSEKAPNVLKAPTSMYRSYEAPPFWKKVKKGLRWAGIVLVGYILIFPSVQRVPLHGKLIASEMRTVDVKAGGEIVAIHKANGDYVQKGEVIAKIYNSQLHQEHERLAAEMRILETELSGLKQRIVSEEAALERFQILLSAGDISMERFDDQNRRVEDIRNQLLVKAAQIDEAAIRLSNLKSRLDDEIVRSPFDGTITSAVEERMNGQIREGESLCSVAFGGMRFEFRVREKAIRSIEPGQSVPLRLEAFPNKKIKGKVDEIRPIVFEDSPKPWMKTYNARILVSSVDPLPADARLGMTAHSRIKLKNRKVIVLQWLDAWREKLTIN